MLNICYTLIKIGSGLTSSNHLDDYYSDLFSLDSQAKYKQGDIFSATWLESEAWYNCDSAKNKLRDGLHKLAFGKHNLRLGNFFTGSSRIGRINIKTACLLSVMINARAINDSICLALSLFFEVNSRNSSAAKIAIMLYGITSALNDAA